MLCMPKASLRKRRLALVLGCLRCTLLVVCTLLLHLLLELLPFL
jgi:hypothetical protein